MTPGQPLQPEHITGLPAWLQITLSVIAFMGAAWIYMAGLFKSLPQPVPAAKASIPDDTEVVPSITVADAKVMAGWIQAIKDGNELEETQLEQTRKAVLVLERIERRLEDLFHEITRQQRPPRQPR